MLPGSLGGQDEDSMCPSLTFKQRIYGFIGCVVVGVLFSILSWVSLWRRDFVQFAIWMSFGTFCSLGGTCFLKGPVKQVKAMFEEKRLEATVVMLCSLVWTLIAAFWLEQPVIVVMMAIIQYLSLAWYALSYIPFARDVVKKCFTGLIS
eukprot:TRINITY_DN6673_c0_g1_i1.p1 TRINITY_DN6673_c0_g1~~TRINITY_DN6673_c0_g1_i1.p1  ORF type:complete len:149 (+),score=39.30 TRINITY_DN6673_c0_g1_i1:60-506(+)